LQRRLLSLSGYSIKGKGKIDEILEEAMIYHLGRLIDHVHIRTADLEASRRFYRSVLMALGRSGFREAPEYFSADELWIDRADGQHSRIHLAFQAADRESVDRFYAAALAAGGRDNGAPGERQYHPGYYAAYVLDPDGNNIEAVWHGPSSRSAASVEVRPMGGDTPPG
jgi:catechol 2,3-dioxygenase-like lactoylglutathione lyase family enzyme